MRSLQRNAGSPAAIRTEHDKTIGTAPFLNWKTDYTKQFGTTSKLETGFKLTSRSTTNDFDASYLNASTGLFESVRLPRGHRWRVRPLLEQA